MLIAHCPQDNHRGPSNNQGAHDQERGVREPVEKRVICAAHPYPVSRPEHLFRVVGEKPIDGDDNRKSAKGHAEYAGAHSMRFLAAGVQGPEYGTGRTALQYTPHVTVG